MRLFKREKKQEKIDFTKIFAYFIAYTYNSMH